MSKKIKESATGIRVFDGLYLKVNGREFRLRDWVYTSFDHADPNRLAMIITNEGFQYNEGFLGYITEFKPDSEEIVAGIVTIASNKSKNPIISTVHTSNVIGWCYVDEESKN